MIAAAAVALAFASAGPTVAVKDDKFVKSSLTVKKGTKVTWKWKGKAPHNIVTKKGPAKITAPTKTTGSFSKKLTKKGTYSLLCSIHAPEMKMTIKVK